MKAVRLLALVLLAASTVYALHRLVYVPLHCARIASISAANVEASPTRETAARARDDLLACRSVTAREAHVAFILGGVFAVLGDDRSAAGEFERALTIERRPEIYFALGMARFGLLQRDAAIDSLTRACAFDPSRLADIPYGDVRMEVERRLRSTYGAGWIR